MRRIALALTLLAIGQAAMAEPVPIASVAMTEWKAVYGRIEARDRVPARARIGGTVVELTVTEGDDVREGQPIARIVDDKLSFQIDALAAQKAALTAQLDNAQTELTRGEELLKQGVSTVQRLDGLRTQVEVLRGGLHRSAPLLHRQPNALDTGTLQGVHHLHHRFVFHGLVGADDHGHVGCVALLANIATGLQRLHALGHLVQCHGRGVALASAFAHAHLAVFVDDDMHKALGLLRGLSNAGKVDLAR